MKTLIVDDHKINRSLLKLLIKEHFPKIKEIDEAESVAASLELLEAKSYDLIFLDIELKDGIGFDILKEITDFVFVIVISSHKEYAIEAFKHNVVDYILRPINIPEFKKAVKKFYQLYEKDILLKQINTPDVLVSDPKGKEESLFVNYKNGYLAVSKQSILFIKAQGKCSEIYIADGKHYTSYKNLKEFENVLPDTFIRIHHSYLVNIKYIVYYSRETSQIKLTTGMELSVSTRKKEELFKKFDVF